MAISCLNPSDARSGDSQGGAETLRTKRDEEAGAAMVELALAISLLCLLLFGIITFGMIMAVKQTVSQAAAEAARAAVPVAQATASGVALAQASNSASWLGSCNQASSALSCAVSGPAPCLNNPSLNCITVTVTYDWSKHMIMPAIPLVPEPGSITSQSVVSLAGP